MKRLVEDLRTLLVLGRVSNLPTVWSNLLAGSLLVNRTEFGHLPLLLIGGSCLYVGGMYLNDFCDAAFDAQYCPERPIPAGKIPRGGVGLLGIAWFAAGLFALACFTWLTLTIALVLIATIVVYDYHHKGVAGAPLVMGLCRFLLYPLAASTSVGFHSMEHIFPAAIALGLYVAGITYVARGESRPEKPSRWALLLLLLPLVGSCDYRNSLSIFFSFLLLLNLTVLFVPLWRKTNRSIGRVVSGLLAAIVSVDLIAVAPDDPVILGCFLFFFILALLLQRIIPAT